MNNGNLALMQDATIFAKCGRSDAANGGNDGQVLIRYSGRLLPQPTWHITG